jgi:uncharacterized protein with PQ loop repeat
MKFNIEIIGYIAGIITTISLACQNVLHLRTLNCIGSAIWVTYGILKNSPSIIFVNVIVIVIQFFLIYKLIY